MQLVREITTAIQGRKGANLSSETMHVPGHAHCRTSDCLLLNVIHSAPGNHTTSTWITSTMSSSRRNSSMRKLREGIELTVFTQEQTVSRGVKVELLHVVAIGNVELWFGGIHGSSGTH